jgi:hypothetical protein
MPSDLKWEEKAEQLEFESLTRVRGAAEKWAASLGAILGLLGTVLLVKGREDITRLTTLFQVLVAGSLLIALACAAIAIYLAALAAQGTPAELRWPIGSRLRTWERAEALKAKRRLKKSRWLTGAVVGILALAVGLTWFGDAQSTETSSNVLLVRKLAPPVCGKLELSPSKALQVKPSDHTAVPIEDADVSVIAIVDDCPAER